MATRQLKGLLIAIAVLAVMGPVAAAPAPPPSAVSAGRLEQISRRYLGTPYRWDSLGDGNGPEPRPYFNRLAVDCQTLIEQVLAEALAPYEGGLLPAQRLIRYRSAQPSYENRYHFCIPDWLTNPWPARDVTEAVAGGRTALISKRVDRPAFLAAHHGDPSRAPTGAESVSDAYIPRAEVRRIAGRIPSGSLVLFVTSQPGIVIGHLGLLFQRDEQPVLRHASETRHRVIDEPLLAYLNRAPRRFLGIQVLQPDVTGLQRSGR